MGREKLLKIIDINEVRRAIDKTEVIIRARALNEKQFKPDVSRQLDSGGKRLRPLILLTASLLNSVKIDAECIDSAAAVELVHQASLFHDRIIDEDDSSNASMLILCGDYLMAEGLGLASEVSGSVGQILSRCVSEMAAGQALQLTDSYKPDPTNAAYLKTARLKTASLFSACCEIAGLQNHLNQTDRAHLKNFGQAFGLAFQIVDDYTDHEFPDAIRQRSVQQAENQMAEAKSSLASLRNSPAKKSLLRLADSYLAATLPRPS
jgi:octaprenyl-diphosphate synthase